MPMLGRRMFMYAHRSVCAVALVFLMVVCATPEPAAAWSMEYPEDEPEITLGELAAEAWQAITGEEWAAEAWEVVVVGDARELGTFVGSNGAGVSIAFDLRHHLDIPIVFEDLTAEQQAHVLSTGAEPWTGLALASGEHGFLGVDVLGIYEAENNVTKIYIVMNVPLCVVAEEFCDGIPALEDEPLDLNGGMESLSGGDYTGPLGCDQYALDVEECARQYKDILDDIDRRVREATAQYRQALDVAEQAAQDAKDAAQEALDAKLAAAADARQIQIDLANESYRQARNAAIAVFFTATAIAKHALTLSAITPPQPLGLIVGGIISGSTMVGATINLILAINSATDQRDAAIVAANADYIAAKVSAEAEYEAAIAASQANLAIARATLKFALCMFYCSLQSEKRQALEDYHACLEALEDNWYGECLDTVQQVEEEVFGRPLLLQPSVTDDCNCGQ